MLGLLYLTCSILVAVGVEAQVNLASAAPFGIIASSAITSTGLSVVTGELGIFPDTASSITGFPPGISGTVHGGDTIAQAAHNDAMTAYTAAAAATVTMDLTGLDLGGMILTPGVYHFSSSAGLTGVLTLDGQNNANSLFIFQIGSTITTATASSVVLINGANACNVFWQVGSSATLGTATNFIGNILALASITANSAVTVQGGLYALTAAVTLIDDQITSQASCGAAVVSTSPTSTVATTLPTSTITETVTASCMPSAMPTCSAVTYISTFTTTVTATPPVKTTAVATTSTCTSKSPVKSTTTTSTCTSKSPVKTTTAHKTSTSTSKGHKTEADNSVPTNPHSGVYKM